jgi:hypothetical protein
MAQRNALLSDERRAWMPWWQFALLGAGGGAIVEVLAIFGCVARWQDARREPNGTIKRDGQELGKYIDVPAHAIMLPVRVVLGAAAAILCGVTGQVTGPYGAVAIGCTAPVLLKQLGSIPQVEKAVSAASEIRKQVEVQCAPAGTETPAEATVPAGDGSLP